MKIDKELAVKILKYQNLHKNFYFPFQVIRKDGAGEDDFVEGTLLGPPAVFA